MDSIEWHIHCAQLREERDRFQAYVHALQPILDPSALGKDADGYRDSALALRRERDEARAEAKRYHDALVARHGGEPVALLEELDASRAEVARLEGLILEAEADIKAMGTEAHPAVLMRLDRLVRRIRAAKGE